MRSRKKIDLQKVLACMNTSAQGAGMRLNRKQSEGLVLRRWPRRLGYISWAGIRFGAFRRCSVP
jgi:hypothetical protein